jgi:hypothetical protein
MHVSFSGTFTAPQMWVDVFYAQWFSVLLICDSYIHVRIQMFDFCLAPDTTGDGTGCDNMTCVIVTFNGLSSSVAQRTGTKRKAEDVTSDNADSSTSEETVESAAKRLKDDN